MLMQLDSYQDLIIERIRVTQKFLIDSVQISGVALEESGGRTPSLFPLWPRPC